MKTIVLLISVCLVNIGTAFPTIPVENNVNLLPEIKKLKIKN